MPKPTWKFAGNTPDGVPRYITQNMDPDTTAPWHEVQVTPGTVPDRMELYGLTTEAEALEHIMWEVHYGLNNDENENILPPKVKENFDRLWGPGHKGLRGKPMTPQEVADNVLRHRNARLASRPKRPSYIGNKRGNANG